MSIIPLKDILISARQESYRMRHYYLGVEHLFIALLEIKSGLASSILAEQGLAPEYVIDAIRRKAGKGSRHRLWAGIPSTHRTEVVLDIAHDIALAAERDKIQERDLLIAILDENDNIPVRVLQSLGVDLEVMRRDAYARNLSRVSTQPFVAIDVLSKYEGMLDNGHLFILRRMFHGYERVRVEAKLMGGYSSATLLVVTPIHMDQREDATVVVKIGQTDSILDEAQRYERFVKATLPPLTARVEDRPTAPDTSELAGVKYTFLTDSTGNPKDLRDAVHNWTGTQLGEWLNHHLYRDFGDNWWKQNRPYRFDVWREYDWVLPPILTLEIQRESKTPKRAHTLRTPIRRSRINALGYGDLVVVENFIVQKVDRENQSIRLALGQGGHTTRAYQIEVTGIDFDRDTYYRGEVVERIVGQIWKRRDEELLAALRDLQPQFDVSAERISVNNILLPNPIKAYHELLDQTIDGTLSTIHGDMHFGNILIGLNDTPLLIDFAHTRDGHTVFDWATLEISIISEMIAPLADDNWDGAAEMLEHLVALNHPDRSLTGSVEVREALQAVRALRQIARQCLAKPEHWAEYHVAIAMLCLRAITWDNMNITARRIMYLLGALAMHEFEAQYHTGGTATTPAPDATDFYQNESGISRDWLFEDEKHTPPSSSNSD